MKMNRRNVLAGLGTAAVGTGAAFGSGAFTSIEAEREVSVTTEGDADAAAGLDAQEDEVEGISNSELSISLDNINEGSTVNLGTVDGDEVTQAAFTIANNGSHLDGDQIDVEADVSDWEEGEDDDGDVLLEAEEGGEIVDLHDGATLTIDEGDDEPVPVAVTIIVDSDGFDDGDITFTVTPA